MPTPAHVAISHLLFVHNALSRGTGPLIPIGQLTLPAVGAPQQYPFDWYAAEGTSLLWF